MTDNTPKRCCEKCRHTCNLGAGCIEPGGCDRPNCPCHTQTAPEGAESVVKASLDQTDIIPPPIQEKNSLPLPVIEAMVDLQNVIDSQATPTQTLDTEKKYKCRCGREIYWNESHCGACDFDGRDTEKRWHKPWCEYFRNNEKCDCGHPLLDTEKGVEELVREFSMLWHDAEGGISVDEADLKEFERILRTTLQAFEAKIREEEKDKGADIATEWYRDGVTAERTRLHAAIEKEKTGMGTAKDMELENPSKSELAYIKGHDAALTRIQELLKSDVR